eukprot:TRINITY_DN8906_c0_g1_i1.p1 TRINITY_DN8906_c0_g1~~TRINITY_DN8906_c0_g1_i1.p1  ORF type:complete len:461 (-),score=60.02 TRINITY_DN8906_c0_g1_i1:21-1403(-)
MANFEDKPAPTREDVLEFEFKKQRLEAERREFEVTQATWQQQQQAMHVNISRVVSEDNGPIGLNIGGTVFVTSLQTLLSDFEPSSMFRALFGGKHEVKRDQQGQVFIDRDPHHFGSILNYLRTGVMFPPQGETDFEKFMLELEYYCLDNALHRLQEGIIVVGGRVRDDETEVTEIFLDSVEKYCPATNKWQILPSINFQKSDGAAAVLPPLTPNSTAELYCLGGQTEKYITSTAEMYTPCSQWQTITDMNSARYVFAATTVNNDIVVLGGHGKDGPMGTCERFNPLTKTWSFIPPMPGKRFALAACTLGNMIYVIGGQDEKGSILNTMESLCPITFSWKVMPPMTSPRKGHVCAVLGGKLYVMGGEDGRKILNTVERFDPEANKWEAVAPMSSRRSFFAAVTLDETVYVLGGFDGHVSLKSVERYDPVHDRWNPVMSMHTRRIGLIAASWPGNYPTRLQC